MTLLEETIVDIKKSGHEIKDIVFIGSEETGHQCSWQQFRKLADFEYDSGFGSQKIATDLVIVFSDGAKMWRDEYDGSEGWAFSAPFKMPEEKHQILTLGDNSQMWATLAQMNRPGCKYGDE